jgi:colanic acid/amylovoran biosynthesis glycosyltransferase
MKIGIVIPSPPAYSETFFISKINGLQATGNEVILFVSHKKDVIAKDVKVVTAPRLHNNHLIRAFQSLFWLMITFLKTPKAVLRLWQFHREAQDSIPESLRSIIINAHILSHELTWLHFGFATMGIDREFVGRAIGAKVAVSFRGYDIQQVALSKDSNYYKRLFENTDVIHSISNYLIDLANQQFKLPSNIKQEVIRPAIDTKKFQFTHFTEKPNAIKKLRLLVVSRLHWIKNIEDIIHALSILINKYQVNAELTIVGDGDQLERLQYAAYQLGVYDDVAFEGKVDSSLVPTFYQTHNIFIQYSHAEGFCNAVLEAQASGILVIVSDADGLKENVINEETGWIVPRCNPEALAHKILEVQSLPMGISEGIRQNARLRVEKHFDLNYQVSQFVKMYSKIDK